MVAIHRPWKFRIFAIGKVEMIDGDYTDERIQSCVSLKTMMRIIEVNHAHHLTESCVSSKQIMRIN